MYDLCFQNRWEIDCSRLLRNNRLELERFSSRAEIDRRSGSSSCVALRWGIGDSIIAGSGATCALSSFSATIAFDFHDQEHDRFHEDGANNCDHSEATRRSFLGCEVLRSMNDRISGNDVKGDFRASAFCLIRGTETDGREFDGSSRKLNLGIDREPTQRVQSLKGNIQWTYEWRMGVLSTRTLCLPSARMIGDDSGPGRHDGVEPWNPSPPWS